MTDFIIDLMVTIWLTILIYLFLSELYFRTRGFKAIKREIEVYPKVCNCSDSIFKNAKNKPFEYVYKYFNVKADEKTLNKLKKTLNDFLAVEEGKKLLERQRNEIIKKIRKELPYFIRRFTGIQRLSRKLGFKDIDLNDSYFPTYTFRCISKYGKITGAFDVVFDLKELEEFIKYLSQKIKFKKSVAGQRALMTPKLREKIKERDGYTCQICGLSNKDEPNLLLEIDHIIPLSKGGMTTEGNLQTLCWRCNRSKGAKI